MRIAQVHPTHCSPVLPLYTKVESSKIINILKDDVETTPALVFRGLYRRWYENTV